MSPSIFQLQAFGVQDVYLTKDPQINIFKYNYYRYVNFATETVKLNMNDIAAFGQKTSCTILKKGHLLSKLYLHIKLPALKKIDGTYLSWSDTIGYSIFNGPIELQIGGIVVDRLYPQFLDAWDDLSNANKNLGRNFMLLKSDIFSATKHNAEKDADLIIPLEFWFTKQYNSALPLLSMVTQDIKINFKFRPFSECINYDGTEPLEIPIIDSSVLAEYIYLDEVILKQFQEQKHMYIIEQVQGHGEEIIPMNTSVYNTLLKFNNPVKELVFFCSETQNIENNNYFCYSKTSNDTALISSASLLLDGKSRFDNLPEFYYRTIFPDSVHSTIPMKYIYTMPFCLKPEDNQPTGSINLSRFNDVTLTLRLANGNPQCKLYVYAISYNIVIIENGVLSFEFLI